MTINESALGQLSASFSNNIKTFKTDADTAITAYVAKVNSIWCSPESKKIGGKIKNCLSKTDQFIAETWFDGTDSGINGVISTNVKNFNSVEKTGFKWTPVAFEEPQIANIEENIDEKFPDGHTGTREGAKASDLDATFDAITDAYVALFKNFTSTVDNTDAFSANQKSALKSGFSSASSNLTKSMNAVKDSIHDVFGNKTSQQEELDSTNATNAQGV